MSSVRLVAERPTPVSFDVLSRSDVFLARAPYAWTMCRNITELRGLEPAATPEEIEAAARQYVRKVSGIRAPSESSREAFEHAVAEVAAVTARLLTAVPARRQPPRSVPPLRRPEVQARIVARHAHRVVTAPD
jgi:hypothetical protein